MMTPPNYHGPKPYGNLCDNTIYPLPNPPCINKTCIGREVAMVMYNSDVRVGF